ncbi:MAG: phosphohydrolase [Ectothiorhodospiraceae bacterium]|nr:phosphohydrolase [Ectothiorhodospiraceae bacterium]
MEKTSLDALTPAEWAVLERQRNAYLRDHQAEQALRLLTASAGDPSFGYTVNMYRHALQSATMALRDGLDEETVVVTLLHDIGFLACPCGHGEMAAALLGPYVSERNRWMLARHAIFQDHHVAGHPGAGRRERWRGHPHFAWTAEWVARYDQNAQDASYDCAPLEVFEPMVRRIFAREPRPIVPD